MTTRECEKRLTDLMETAWQIFKQYDPEGKHLELFATKTGFMATGYKGQSGDLKIIVNGYKSPEGRYLYSKEEG